MKNIKKIVVNILQNVLLIIILAAGVVNIQSIYIVANAEEMKSSNLIYGINSKGKIEINDYFEFDTDDILLLRQAVESSKKKVNKLLEVEE